MSGQWRVEAGDVHLDIMLSRTRERYGVELDVATPHVPYREAIHLFYYEGYSTAQIAQILDQKESTVRSRLKRGREKLRPLLEEVGALG